VFRKNDKHLQMQLFSSVDSLPQAQAKRLERSWAGVFYRECFSRIDERPFAVLYSPKDSRPNIPVNVLVALEALKAGFGWSDEEMYDAFCFDLQVRYALGYRNLGEGTFDLRTVYYFRQRLAEHMGRTGENLIERAFEEVTDEQIRALRLKTGKVRMDSTEIASNICNMSRLHLLVEVLQRVHRMLSEIDQARYWEAFIPYLQGNSSQYVYRVRGEDGKAHMERVGELMGKLVEELAASYGDDAIYLMLVRVFGEHFVLEEDRLRLKAGRELSAESLQSPDDVEATFRNKNRRSYKGYVANVTETCDPANPVQLIAKVQTAPNSTNDDDLLIEAIPSLKERLDINEVHTDGGYNSDESYRAVRDSSICHVQTAIRGHSATAHLGLDQFEIVKSEAGEPVGVTCPYGQTVPVQVGKGRERYLAHFDAALCSACPFLDRCPTREQKRPSGRTLYFDRHDAEIANRRRRIAQDQQLGRNLRVAIESTIASLKCPFNFGQLPVRGLFRVSMVMIGSATMANVRRIHRYITAKPAEEAEATTECAYKRDLLTWLSGCVGLVAHLVGYFGSLFGRYDRDGWCDRDHFGCCHRQTTNALV
jgi:hypothetical protein